MGLLTAALICGGGMAWAQVGGVNGGINANGTPRQQDPGASMTNGAGTGAMTPNVTGATTGGAGIVSSAVPKTIPPTAITHGTVTANGPSQ
jgi:hypothetical protein